jgi:hypothetical protein
MLTNNGNQEGQICGAIMQSGGPIPVGDIENGQQYYDIVRHPSQVLPRRPTGWVSF